MSLQVKFFQELFSQDLLLMTSSSRQIEAEKHIAEKANGLAAIIGVVAALGAYFFTGQIIPGVL